MFPLLTLWIPVGGGQHLRCKLIVKLFTKSEQHWNLSLSFCGKCNFKAEDSEWVNIQATPDMVDRRKDSGHFKSWSFFFSIFETCVFLRRSQWPLSFLLSILQRHALAVIFSYFVSIVALTSLSLTNVMLLPLPILKYSAIISFFVSLDCLTAPIFLARGSIRRCQHADCIIDPLVNQ